MQPQIQMRVVSQLVQQDTTDWLVDIAVLLCFSFFLHFSSNWQCDRLYSVL